MKISRQQKREIRAKVKEVTPQNWNNMIRVAILMVMERTLKSQTKQANYYNAGLCDAVVELVKLMRE